MTEQKTEHAFDFDHYDRKGAEAEYDSFYASADFTELSKAESATVRSFVKKLRLAKGARGLDIPCGTGKNAAFLAQTGLVVTGIDISSEGIKVAKSRYPSIDFEVGDATALGVTEGTLDFIFCSGLSLYNDTNTQALTDYTDYLASFLKPGGVLMFIKTTSQTDRLSKSGSRMDYKLETFERIFKRCHSVAIKHSYCSIPQIHPVLGSLGFNPLVSFGLSLAGRLLGKPVRVYIALERRK